MSRALKRLRQLYHEIREHGASTEWIADADLKVLKEHWASEEFKKKSNINSTSRRSSKGGSVHTGGSVTIETTRLKMTKKLGRPPTHSELFRETHTRKHDKSVWVDAQSENTRIMLSVFKKPMSGKLWRLRSEVSLSPTSHLLMRWKYGRRRWVVMPMDIYMVWGYITLISHLVQWPVTELLLKMLMLVGWRFLRRDLRSKKSGTKRRCANTKRICANTKRI